MKAAVLNIGTEVLIGHTINTNLSLIANMCADYGILIQEQLTVPDSKLAILTGFYHLYDKFDLVFVTGGLGPTDDDITSATIAEALGKELIMNEEVMNGLESYFRNRNYVMTENNRKQAYFPKDSTIIHNDYGTASGFYLNKNGKIVLVMPGPPMELASILRNFLENYVPDSKLTIKTINTYGIGESMLESRLREMNLDYRYDINTFFRGGGVDIKIITEVDDEWGMEKVLNSIRDEFKDYIYDEDSQSMAKSLLEKLFERGETVAFAESCTGGRISADFTANPGASKALICSLVTYSEESKQIELGVKKETLEKYTAVSEEVAKEMLEGIKNKYDADYYGVVTGYASPPEGHEELNGLVYIGVYDRKRDKSEIFKNEFRGSRDQIIVRATNNLFFRILTQVKLGG